MACLKWQIPTDVTASRARETLLNRTGGSTTGALRCRRLVPSLQGTLTWEADNGGKKNSAIRAVADTTPESDDYNATMKREMRNPYEYHHELGTLQVPIYLEGPNRCCS
jgi:hypothetical protein